jgi:uncharacterized membrane protein YdbT with pleckstrin-like domain
MTAVTNKPAPTAAAAFATTPAKPVAPEAEQQLWQGGYSPKAMYGSWLLAGIVTIVAALASILAPNPAVWLVAAVVVPVLWIVFLAKFIVKRLSIHYTLTNQRLLHKKGILTQKSDRIEVIDIDDVQFKQSLIGRMFNFGDVQLLSSDVSDKQFTLEGIDDVQRVANLIDNARREERRKRAVYMENV